MQLTFFVSLTTLPALFAHCIRTLYAEADPFKRKNLQGQQSDNKLTPSFSNKNRPPRCNYLIKLPRLLTAIRNGPIPIYVIKLSAGTQHHL